MNYHKGDFPETRWTMIRKVVDGDEGDRDTALAGFCRDYWFPLYAWARGRGKSPHDAEDSVQSFFLKLLNSSEILGKASPECGKLRTWLITAFRNFMTNEWQQGQAAKRGGEFDFIAADIEVAETLVQQYAGSAPAEFDRLWALNVLRKARGRLEQASERMGKSEEFRVLQGFLSEGSCCTTAEASAALGKTESAIRMAVSRLRSDYQQAIRQEVRDTLGPDDNIEEEIEYLISCL